MSFVKELAVAAVGTLTLAGFLVYSGVGYRSASDDTRALLVTQRGVSNDLGRATWRANNILRERYAQNYPHTIKDARAEYCENPDGKSLCDLLGEIEQSRALHDELSHTVEVQNQERWRWVRRLYLMAAATSFSAAYAVSILANREKYAQGQPERQHKKFP